MTRNAEAAAEPRGHPGLYRLLAWLSPGFPIGAFSYSHGLEAAVADGTVQDRATLEGWIEAVVAYGGGRVDADILCAAYRGARDGDLAALDAANRRGIAYRATAELALESAQPGAAFLVTCRAAWPDAFIEAWADPHPNPPPLAGEGTRKLLHPPPQAGEGRVGAAVGTGKHGATRHDCADRGTLPPQATLTLPRLRGRGEPVRRSAGIVEGGEFRSRNVCHAAIFGAAAARAGIALDDALTGYLEAFAANLVSAGLRLGIIGQTDGQRILAALEPAVGRAAEAAMVRDPGDFGGATFAADLASMAHETQYTRLFRS